MPIGTNVEGKMVAALRRLGFDRRLRHGHRGGPDHHGGGHRACSSGVKNGGTLPLITSCSPGWVKFCEHYYPDMMPNLSTCKSPQQMFGALVKTYYAEKMGIDPKDICRRVRHALYREEVRGRPWRSRALQRRIPMWMSP